MFIDDALSPRRGPPPGRRRYSEALVVLRLSEFAELVGSLGAGRMTNKKRSA